MRLLKRRKREEAAGEEAAGSEAGGTGAASPDGADADPVRSESATAGVSATAVRPDEEAGGAGTGGPLSGDAAPDEAAPGDAAIAMADGHEEQEESAPPDPAPVGAASAVVEEEGETRLPLSFFFDGLLKNERTPSREELDRQAEADFRAAIAPSVGPLRELAPDASSPEEALHQLTERWGEALPDPEAERLRGQDPFERGPADTAVYYRIRRHFVRPSRHVGFGREAWRPPPGLAREALPNRGRSSRQALPPGQRSRRS